MSSDSVAAFFEKIELACTTFWDERSYIVNWSNINKSFILGKLQGVLYTTHAIASKTGIITRSLTVIDFACDC